VLAAALCAAHEAVGLLLDTAASLGAEARRRCCLPARQSPC